MTIEEKNDILKELRSNPNNMSYWLPQFSNKGFYIPETVIIPFGVERLDWLFSDNYKQERIDSFTQDIHNKLHELNFNVNRELFIKTGCFSNKFTFTDCHVKSLEKIGEQYLNIFYAGMCVGCDVSPEIVVREFIHTNYERKCIYDGMKLNTEFRVFYDFDSKKIAGIFNYWDRETMQKNLKGDDLENFNECIDEIEKDFLELKPKLEEHINQHISKVPQKNIWSIDFMWDGEKFWLIDAAIGEQSYYFEKI